MSKKDQLQIKYDPTYHVVTHNDLLRGRQKMTLRESQLFAIAVSQVVKEDKDFRTYTTSVPELAAFMGIDENSLYRDLEGICTALMSRVVKIPKPNNEGKRSERQGWEIFHFVSYASYDSGTLTLRLSDEIKPFVLELEQMYSQPMLGTLMTFRSYYTTRLYQYVKAEHGEHNAVDFYFSCDDLRELFQTYVKDEKGNIIKERYKLSRDLIRYTIKPALAELHGSDFAYVYNYEELREHVPGKRGKPALVGVQFSIILFDDRDAASRKEAFKKHLPQMRENLGKMVDFDEVVPPKSKEQKPEQIAIAGFEGMPEPKLK